MNRSHSHSHSYSQCGGCGGEKRWLLHNVRHRAAYRRLCTNCILKTHQGLFCPYCFHVYDDVPPPQDRLMCLKCPSISHLSCVLPPPPLSSTPTPTPSPSFLCPSCSVPNFSFFDFSYDHHHLPLLSIDKNSARALVAAAKIAAISMTKAAAVARLEAERRVKEATLAKKRAREALERLAFLSSTATATATATAAAAKEKNKDRDKDSAARLHHLHKLTNNNNNKNGNKKRILAGGMPVVKKDESQSRSQSRNYGGALNLKGGKQLS